MIDRDALLADLKKQVVALEKDLLERASDQELPFHAPLYSEWEKASKASRTAARYESWLDDQVTQSAVAWVLGTVFLRFCEDNQLIGLPHLAGPGELLDLAKEREQDYFSQYENREKTDREWIIAGFEHMADASSIAAGLFDRTYNPMWRILPSLEASKKLIAFWRTTGANGQLIHDFTDPEWNTRFLGDLYQDLSEHAKKTYALLQTPEFVEEFILDLTLTPAIEAFGLDPEPPTACPKHLNLPRGLRVIDPTCGSGHFLLGAFKRLLSAWELQAPGADRWDLINRVLYSIHGVDKNPFAVSISKFRLLIAAMKSGGIRSLESSPSFSLNIAVGDTLLFGRGAPGVQETIPDDTLSQYSYSFEDIGFYEKENDLLGIGSYHAVFGNPPYIEVSDPRERSSYKDRYKSCHDSWTLTIPFFERFFQLAIRGSANEIAGFVGKITGKSFTKSEFGKKLILEYMRTIDLTHVIDSSGAFIPGHGTPTIIVAGRRQWPQKNGVRTVRTVNGEPRQPAVPEEGYVWQSITRQINSPGSNSKWVSVEDLDRKRYFDRHPWTLESGGLELLEAIEKASTSTLSMVADSIGRTTVLGADDAWLMPDYSTAKRRGEENYVRPFATGASVRDYQISNAALALTPYLDLAHTKVCASNAPIATRSLWPVRTVLYKRTVFGKTLENQGRFWYEHLENYTRKLKTLLSISFPFIQTHNHFVLDTGRHIFNRHAPVIKLPEKASESDHYALLSVLNSSAACFWLKQMCHDKGGQGINEGFKSQPWERFYEFTGAKVERLPLPSTFEEKIGAELHQLACDLSSASLPSVFANNLPTAEVIQKSKEAEDRIRLRMIALQEELDWRIYRKYGLLSEQESAEVCASTEEIPGHGFGERAFEIVLARKMAAQDVETQWFKRHSATPITEIPENWTERYRKIIQKRIEIIEARRDIALIERPECKRRWSFEQWEKKKRSALRGWLLDRCEKRDLWFSLDDLGNEQPRPMTINRLADRLRKDENFVSVARLYAEDDMKIEEVLNEIIADEHVPYLATLRYKDAGIRTRIQWEQTWRLQREEDATGKRLDIKVPAPYKSSYFQKPSYWRNRGKFDVPKERFISYPGANPDGDGSLLIGWAGWDHQEQAHALQELIEDRTTREGWDTARLKPLIAGLAEVMPWVKQWHNEVDPAFGQSPADAYATYLEDQKLRHGFTDEDLKAWRPEKKPTRGRKRKAE